MILVNGFMYYDPRFEERSEQVRDYYKEKSLKQQIVRFHARLFKFQYYPPVIGGFIKFNKIDRWCMCVNKIKDASYFYDMEDTKNKYVRKLNFM